MGTGGKHEFRTNRPYNRAEHQVFLFQMVQDKYFDATEADFAALERRFNVRVTRKVLSRHFEDGVYGCLYIEFLNRDKSPEQQCTTSRQQSTAKAARKADKKALAAKARAARMAPTDGGPGPGPDGDLLPAGEGGGAGAPPHEVASTVDAVRAIAADDVDAVRAIEAVLAGAGREPPGPAALAAAIGLNAHKIKRLLKKYNGLLKTAQEDAGAPASCSSSLTSVAAGGSNRNCGAEEDHVAGAVGPQLHEEDCEGADPPPPIWKGRMPEHWPVSEREALPGGGRDATNAHPICWGDVMAMMMFLRLATTGCGIFLEDLAHVAERWVDGKQYDVIYARWGS